MYQVDAKHQRELDQIRQNYFGYLRKAAETLEAVVVRLSESSERESTGSIQSAGLNKAHSLAHKIKGNGAMYGYPDLGFKAERVEAILKSDMTESVICAVSPAITELINCISDICSNANEEKNERLFPTLAVQSETEVTVSRPAKTQLKRKRVILAYQDIWLSNMLKSILEPDYDIMECHDEVTLLTAVMDFAPDLLILDDDLPRQGGVAWLTIPQFRDTNVYLIFNGENHEKTAAAISAGVAGYSDSKSDILQISQSTRNMLDQPPKRVLIADDDLAVREMLRHHLESTGLRVDVVGDGIEALEYLALKTPDVIILDRFMPRLEGGTVLYEIQNRANLKSIPVLILTAMVNRGEAKTWFERGAADFIPKPFDPEEVSMRVKQHLQSHGREK